MSQAVFFGTIRTMLTEFPQKKISSSIFLHDVFLARILGYPPQFELEPPMWGKAKFSSGDSSWVYLGRCPSGDLTLGWIFHMSHMESHQFKHRCMEIITNRSCFMAICVQWPEDRFFFPLDRYTTFFVGVAAIGLDFMKIWSPFGRRWANNICVDFQLGKSKPPIRGIRDVNSRLSRCEYCSWKMLKALLSRAWPICNWLVLWLLPN